MDEFLGFKAKNKAAAPIGDLTKGVAGFLAAPIKDINKDVTNQGALISVADMIYSWANVNPNRMEVELKRK
jgi:hypothetical protein